MSFYSNYGKISVPSDITSSAGDIIATTGQLNGATLSVNGGLLTCDNTTFGPNTTYAFVLGCSAFSCLNPVYTFSQGYNAVTGSGTLSASIANGIIQPTVGTGATYTLTLPNANDVYTYFTTFLFPQAWAVDRSFFIYLVDPPAAILLPDTWNFANSADGSFVLSSPLAINPVRGTNFPHVCRITNANPLAAGAITIY